MAHPDDGVLTAKRPVVLARARCPARYHAVTFLA